MYIYIIIVAIAVNGNNTNEITVSINLEFSPSVFVIDNSVAGIKKNPTIAICALNTNS